MTPHNNAKKEEIAKTVLMPGDPLRAKYIAENFLSNSKLVNSVRGMFAYTGKYKEKDITVMASGIGNPSMGLYSYELYKFYDVDNIIRIGTTGSYKKKIGLKSIILAEKSFSRSSYAKMQFEYEDNIIASSDYLNNIIKQTAEESNIKLYPGTVNSVETIYGKIPETEDGKTANCIAGEMETFALYSNAKYLNKNAACIMTVSNILPYKEGDPELSAEERQTALNEMIVLALEAGHKA